MKNMKAKVKRANNLNDVFCDLKLSDLKILRSKNDEELIIEHFKALDVSTTQFESLVDLLERNMKEFYEKTPQGWNRKDKISELLGNNSRYLIARRRDLLAGFIHFQFDLDYGRQVLYCYEIQIERNFQRSGLGRHFMKSLEQIASACQLSLVVLTVFKFNEKAVNFFYRAGYIEDETCPVEEEGKHYYILSKKTV